MNNEKAVMPQLRFSDFNETFYPQKLKEITTYVDYRGKGPVKTESGIVLVTAKNIKSGFIDYDCSKEYIAKDKFDDVMKKGKVEIGDVLFTTEAPMGNVSQVDNINIALAQRVIKLRGKECVENSYLMHYMLSTSYQKQLTKKSIGSTVLGIKGSELHNSVVHIHKNKKEQQKIASFLSNVDTKITQITDKHRLLKAYKKGVMQQVFNQEIRFRDKSGEYFQDWENRKLSDVFVRITNKNIENNQNVLTISAQRGLINQKKYFNKSVSAKDVTGYYLLKNGDFAYNKSYSAGYPMGAIKRLNNYDKGIVSTLYICFRVKDGYNADFYEQYLDNGYINHAIHKIAQEGARNHGLLNVSVIEFFNDIHVAVPSYDEQLKIAAFLKNIDQKIKLLAQQLEQAKSFKQGLLQQMFV